MFACSRCNAPLQIPADLSALDAPCNYCGARTPIPADLAQIRMQQHAQFAAMQQQAAIQAQIGAATQNTMSFVKWVIIVSVAAPLVITAVVLFFVFGIVERVTP
jgi:hypothetical protein